MILKKYVLLYIKCGFSITTFCISLYGIIRAQINPNTLILILNYGLKVWHLESRQDRIIKSLLLC
jgi:hypothetical protein